MYRVEQHVIDAPGIHAQARSRHVALGDLVQPNFQFFKNSQHVPPERAKNMDGSAGKGVDLLKPQPAGLELAKHDSAALCAKVASDVIIRVHASLSLWSAK